MRVEDGCVGCDVGLRGVAELEKSFDEKRNQDMGGRGNRQNHAIDMTTKKKGLNDTSGDWTYRLAIFILVPVVQTMVVTLEDRLLDLCERDAGNGVVDVAVIPG